MDKDKMNELKKKSLSGGTGIRKNHYIRMKCNDYVKSTVAIIGATALVVAGTIGAGKQLSTNIKNSMVLNSLSSDFRTQVIHDNTHRTQDLQHFYYDTEKIAETMSQMDDFDQAVYFLYDNVGERSTSDILDKAGYDGLEGYLEDKQYENIDVFKKNEKERILLASEIKEKEQQLDSMKHELQERPKEEKADEKMGVK